MMAAASDLRHYSEHELPTLLVSILASGPWLDEVAGRSYAHDNGFIKIVLEDDPEEDRSLRLHIWPAEAEPETNIHNHRWDFSSLVISGELEFEEFVVDEAGQIEADGYGYLPTPGLEYELQPTGPAHLRSASVGSRRSGEVYEMIAETLHRTWGKHGTRTVTLLQQGTRRRQHADVYVTDSEGIGGEVVNEALEPDQLRSELEAVLTELNAAHS